MRLKNLILAVIFLVFIGKMLSAQDKDSIPEQYIWILKKAYIPQKVEFDTIINQYHTFSPIEKISYSNTFLGNIGSEYHSNIFIDELDKAYTDFLPENPFAGYLMTAMNQKFYFSKKPYIELKYSMSTKKWNENNFGIIYTQNLNEKLNFGMNYNLISADGIFPRSKTSEHSLNFFTSYKGDKYSIHAAYIRNKFRLQESGGIIPIAITDPDLSFPQIANAASVFYKSSFLISQEYKLGREVEKIIDDTLKQIHYVESGKLNYIINYDHNYRNYRDDNPQNAFYRDIYIDSLSTNDSLNLKLFKNTLYWTFREVNVGKAYMMNSFGVEYEVLKNYNYNGDTINNDGDFYNSLSAHFNSVGTFEKFRFELTSQYYLQGHKFDDYQGAFSVEKDFYLKKNISTLNLDVEFARRKPTLFEQYYYSNNFKWENQFGSKYTAKVKFGFSLPKRKLKVELALAQLNNYIYFDSLAIPVQYKLPVNILSVKGQKEFVLGKFHSLNKAVWQIADNSEVLSIPEASFYHNLYLDLHYKKAAHLHVGYELYYSTIFDALSFMPATGQFYQKREMKSGDFPLINVFMNIRIQSVLLFFKFENISFQFINNEYYYLANNHPLNPTIFKFGASWRFKD